jgi:hypothetical protein
MQNKGVQTAKKALKLKLKKKKRIPMCILKIIALKESP